MKVNQIVYLLIFLAAAGLVAWSISRGGGEGGGEDELRVVGGAERKLQHMSYQEMVEKFTKDSESGKELDWLTSVRLDEVGWVTGIAASQYGKGRVAVDMDGPDLDKDGPELVIEMRSGQLTERRRPTSRAMIEFTCVVSGHEVVDDKLMFQVREGEWDEL